MIADLDIKDVDLDSAAVTAHSQVIEVSFHQGPVEATSAILDAGQVLTMKNLALYSAMQSAVALQGAALQPMATMPWPGQPTSMLHTFTCTP